MNRIEEKFKQLKTKNKKAFIAFITAGYPSLMQTSRLVLALEESGADIVELGVPFSDPLADGPIIQEASAHSLKKGTNPLKILKLVRNLRKHTDIPICLMTYYNPVFCIGPSRFIRLAAISGVDGLIIPDLPPEEAREFVKFCKRWRIININFIAPTSSAQRVISIAKKAKGFIYYVSTCGVTGRREKLSADLKTNLLRIKKITSTPVCVGFGISNPRQAKAAAKFSDGVIVGSAIVEKIKNNLASPDLSKKVALFVKGFNA